jgi:hypothetical protein
MGAIVQQQRRAKPSNTEFAGRVDSENRAFRTALARVEPRHGKDLEQGFPVRQGEWL